MIRSFVLSAGLVLPWALYAQSGAFQWPGGARAGVALTYDDGIDGHLDIAMPDLEKANLRGTFYVPGNSASLRKRMEEWRAAARRGHELGNHTLFHPCLTKIPGYERKWVTPLHALDNYTVPRMGEEIHVMNTLLLAVDAQSVRTLAYPCGDEIAGGASYVDTIRPEVPAARGYRRGGKDLAGPRTVDPYRVPGWAVEGASGAELIAWVEEAAQSGKLAVFIFHGVGGGHSINVARESHAELLKWLDAHRDRVWTAPFLKVMEHVMAERNRR